MGLHASHDEGSSAGRTIATAAQLSMLLDGLGAGGNRDRERVAALADASNGTPQATSRGPDYAEMMARYLGPGIVAAFADSDVTEIYLNAHDERVRIDTRSRGKVTANATRSADRLEMLLNAVASSHGVALDPEEPSLQTELPLAVFGGARLVDLVDVLHGGSTSRRAVERARIAGLAPDGRFLLHQCTETGTWESVEQ